MAAWPALPGCSREGTEKASEELVGDARECVKEAKTAEIGGSVGAKLPRDKTELVNEEFTGENRRVVCATAEG